MRTHDALSQSEPPYSEWTVSHGISWLAGFIDGEGTFVLITRSRGGTAPHFGLTGGNEDNIRAAKAVISEIVGHEIRYRLHTGASSKDRRPFWYINLQRHDDLKRLCEAILPFARGKRPNIDLMLRYLAIAPGVAHGELYLHERLRLVQEMRALNRTYSRGQWQAQQQEVELTAVHRAGEAALRSDGRPQEDGLREDMRRYDVYAARRPGEQS